MFRFTTLTTATTPPTGIPPVMAKVDLGGYSDITQTPHTPAES